MAVYIGENQVGVTRQAEVDGATALPTPDKIAKFNPTARMNSADMSSQEVENFVDSLDLNRNMLDFFYPVGSYYETSDTTFDPNIHWGGTWVLEPEGQVHVSSGENYEVGDTGGEASHTVTSTEVPDHDHSLYGTGVAMISNYANRTFFQNTNSPAAYMVKNWATLTGASGYSWTHNSDAATTSSTEYYSSAVATNLAGKTGKIGNPTSGTDDLSLMQPYIVVNRWHRTAQEKQ